MPKYFVRFDVVESWKGTFDADNLAHAKELIKSVIAGDENFDDLENADSRNSGIEVEIYEDSLEQLPDTYPLCPSCGGYIPNNETPGAYSGALSRKDNKTEICSACGTAEALADFARHAE
jgi:hypothetical protein